MFVTIVLTWIDFRIHLIRVLQFIVQVVLFEVDSRFEFQIFLHKDLQFLFILMLIRYFGDRSLIWTELFSHQTFVLELKDFPIDFDRIGFKDLVSSVDNKLPFVKFHFEDFLWHLKFKIVVPSHFIYNLTLTLLSTVQIVLLRSSALTYLVIKKVPIVSVLTALIKFWWFLSSFQSFDPAWQEYLCTIRPSLVLITSNDVLFTLFLSL